MEVSPTAESPAQLAAENPGQNRQNKPGQSGAAQNEPCLVVGQARAKQNREKQQAQTAHGCSSGIDACNGAAAPRAVDAGFLFFLSFMLLDQGRTGWENRGKSQE